MYNIWVDGCAESEHSAVREIGHVMWQGKETPRLLMDVFVNVQLLLLLL